MCSGKTILILYFESISNKIAGFLYNNSSIYIFPRITILCIKKPLKITFLFNKINKSFCSKIERHFCLITLQVKAFNFRHTIDCCCTLMGFIQENLSFIQKGDLKLIIIISNDSSITLSLFMNIMFISDTIL